MLALSDTLLVTLGGVIAAAITGAFAFAGVLVNARAQQKPVTTVIDGDDYVRIAGELTEARKRIDELIADRDQWRSMAIEWLPRQAIADAPE